MTPGILNGLYVSSYVFLGHMPDDLTCVIPVLSQAYWTYDEMKNISTRSITDKCKIRDWNYTLLSEHNFESASQYITTIDLPAEIPCKRYEGNYFFYGNEGLSIVPEWDLVCDREILRTTVQVALYLGKFAGAFIFGIIADKYGRKTSVTLASILYIICGPVSAFVNTYWLFLIGRIGLGLAGSGVYHSAYTILTEFAAIRYRSTLSIFFSVSYPIGMMILAIFAYFIHPWRQLQLALSIPAVFLVVHFFLLDESPRWLMSKGKFSQAYKIVFGKSMDENESMELERAKERRADNSKTNGNNNFVTNVYHSIRTGLSELIDLYGNKLLRRRLLICHFTFFMASLTYYVIALNGDNFLANQYFYVAVTGLTEVPSYIIPCIMFKWMGRKRVSLLLFLLAGCALLSILSIPLDYTDAVISVALFGRMCISAVFVVVILHTAELFPTTVRSSAIGTSSTMAHIGSISSPYIVDGLGSLVWFIPTTVCGICSIIAGLLVLALPETEHVELNDTVEEETAREIKSV
ncbi:Solute carrier family 22 member 16 [Pseudolycoriella hygida]|uniref:Solute carrier family 22 member 16 n=1 Tax=Pseudolycoriella hygida TaxID=35572 RepID=A0A9Q0MUG5_9DIPT|nr:Solute carrier family 22 member 16 [Pseudolycoriella hygida]